MFTLGSIAAFRGIVITSFIKGASDANYIFLIFVMVIYSIRCIYVPHRFCASPKAAENPKRLKVSLVLVPFDETPETSAFAPRLKEFNSSSFSLEDFGQAHSPSV